MTLERSTRAGSVQPLARTALPPSRAGGVRLRARQQLTEEILASARQQLADQGAASLSLRAIARELGMSSSAIYRYVSSRDELLTRLILDAYDALGAAVERAEALVADRADLRARWRTVGLTVRAWAQEHPHEYGLIYGTPVPGYVAPDDTIRAARRVTDVLTAIVVDGQGASALRPVRPTRALQAHDLAAFESAFREISPGTEVSTTEVVLQAIMAWTHLFGAVSFELFGHRVGTVDDPTHFFGLELDRLADHLGLPASPA